jgi:preprotein translocase subunit YajC
MEKVLPFLEHPNSHVLTLVIGMAIVYVFVARPLMKRYDRLQETVLKVLTEMEQALKNLE